jgi:uncharacterized protein (TIGR00369 family)
MTCDKQNEQCHCIGRNTEQRRQSHMTHVAGISATGSPPPAPLPRDLTLALSGLDQVRAMRDGKFGLAPMQALMNMRLIEAEDGLVVFSAIPEQKHYNPRGTVHGAFTAAVLDSAMGLAVFTKLAAGADQTTLEFKLNFVRPMSAQTGEVRGEGLVVHCGRTIATAEGRLLGPDGKLIAHGSTTCMIFHPQPGSERQAGRAART